VDRWCSWPAIEQALGGSEMSIEYWPKAKFSIRERRAGTDRRQEFSPLNAEVRVA